MSMYKAKKYYVDENNNMIGYPNYVQNKTEANPMPFHSKLRMKKSDGLIVDVIIFSKTKMERHIA